MQIGGIQKLTLIDFPGKVACTVFLAGCNFFCPWCYSRELVLPKEMKKLPQVNEKEFFNFLKERKGLLDGVVVCGGEPTLNKELPELCQKVKQMGYAVKLDTNGSNPMMLSVLIEEKLVDYVAMDVKLPLGRYLEVCRTQDGVFDIQQSINIIKQNKIDYEFRTTVVSNIHTEEDIFSIARWISPAKKYFLQNFRPEKTIDPEFEKVVPYSEEFLAEIQKKLEPMFEVCQVRHLN
ncbi:MAG: anaerobic ribonucleoside-triphosphate reductase activating protein [Candidatus Paceibacterota bacterium]|jgi:pyruvate formate lyase activating enzyme